MTSKSLLSMFKSKLRLAPVYLLVIPISFLLKNIRTRVFFVRVDRFGHLALNTHLFFIRHKLHHTKKRSLLIFPSRHSRRVSNKELMLMFIEYAAQRKHVHTYSSSFLHVFLDLFKHEFTKRGVCLDLPMDSREEEFQLGVSTIKFDAQQIRYGEEMVANMPLPRGKKIVTVFARDSSYLEHYFPGVDWSYHAYRNCNINTYIDAIEYLIEKGYVVVRLGSEFSKPIAFYNDHYFEYSLSYFKSDFLDLYLVYKSVFVIGSTSGATDIATVFNVPFAGVNYAPFVESPLGKDDLYIQKRLKNENGDVIPFKDVVDNPKYYSYDGKKMEDDYGMTYVDNTAKEILELVEEMHYKISGHGYTASDINLLQEYHEKFCNRNKWSNRGSPISVTWLKNNGDLYLD